jgi:hypothetical protein
MNSGSEVGRPALVVSPSDLGSIVPPGLGGLIPHREPRSELLG